MNRFVSLLAALLVTLPAFAETTAIVGGTVHTVGSEGKLENATIIIVDGRITAVGSGVGVPDGATVIDASGKIVTPGLFSPIGRLGLVDVSSSSGPVDSAQTNEFFTAGFDVADAYNRRSVAIPIQRIDGITRAATVPSPGSDEAHVLSGLAAIVNLGDKNVLDKRGAAMVVTLGESGSHYAGGSRTAAWLTLRNSLDEALDYREHKRDVERGMRREYQHSIADLEALQGVIAGDTPLLVNVHRASDIETLIALTEEYGLDAIIAGGAEAWMVADELASAEIPVILQVTSNLPGNFDQLNARRGAASILATAGVLFALSDSQSESNNARNITQSAGNAVADGLSWDMALRAITLAPAEIYGVDSNVGSIEAGKAADIVIWPADPFELTTYADQVLINGVVIPMESRQTMLRDRYLQMDSEKPPAYRDR
jgi:hypothetical protein